MSPPPRKRPSERSLNIVGQGRLEAGGAGTIQVGPAVYRIRWDLQEPHKIGVEVFHRKRPCGGGELRKSMAEPFWEGEIQAESIRYYTIGTPEGSGKDRAMKLEWIDPRCAIHERESAPDWAKGPEGMLGPEIELVEHEDD